MQLRFLHELGTENSRHLTFYLAVQPMPNANKHHFSCPLRTAGLPKLITSSITSWKNCPSRDQVNNLIGFTVNNVYVVWLSIKLCYNQKSAWDLEKSVKKNLWLRMSSRNLGAWNGWCWGEMRLQILGQNKNVLLFIWEMRILSNYSACTKCVFT